MRFLVMAKPKHPIPQEIVPSLLEGLTGWIRKYKGQKKMEQAWGLAGQPAGAIVLNVGSLEELDAIVMEMPSAPFAAIEIYPLVDAEAAHEQARKAFAAMAAPPKR